MKARVHLPSAMPVGRADGSAQSQLPPKAGTGWWGRRNHPGTCEQTSQPGEQLPNQAAKTAGFEFSIGASRLVDPQSSRSNRDPPPSTGERSMLSSGFERQGTGNQFQMVRRTWFKHRQAFGEHAVMPNSIEDRPRPCPGPHAKRDAMASNGFRSQTLSVVSLLLLRHKLGDTAGAIGFVIANSCEVTQHPH